MKKKFLLRISPELWDELNRWAADEMRSVNAQMEFLLHQAVQTRRKKMKNVIDITPSTEIGGKTEE